MEKAKLGLKEAIAIAKIRELDGTESLELLAARKEDVTLVFRRAQLLSEDEIAIDGEVLAIRFRNGDIEQIFLNIPAGVYKVNLEALAPLGMRAREGLD